jgi:hypothetical protein
MRTLLIFSSFSGNTEETLSGIEALPADASNVVVVTPAGAWRSLARERGYPLIVIPTKNEPDGFQPRSAFGLHRDVSGAGASRRRAHEGSGRHASRPAGVPAGLDLRPEAADLASWLGDRIP